MKERPLLNQSSVKPQLRLNGKEYLEMPGLNVMLNQHFHSGMMFPHDYYPEGHQGGVTIILNGLRVATNGDIRLEPAPGPMVSRTEAWSAGSGS